MALRRVTGPLTVTLLAVITLFVAVNVRSVYAQTISVTPNPVTQGSSFQVLGTGFGFMDTPSPGITIYASASCSGSTVFVDSISADSSGNVGPVTFSSSSLSVGVHCVAITLHFTAAVGSVTVTAGPPIPEYPLGLPLLAIFMVLGYAVIKRRIRN